MILRADKIKKEYLRERAGSNVFCAVQETDLTLRPGELVVLTGRSGSGKSTLLNMLAGILAPTSGRVALEGEEMVQEDLYRLDDAALAALRNRHFGYVPQGQSAVGSLTVIENVLLPCALYGEGGSKEEDRARGLLSRMEIAELADVMPSELSGGELRRMAIARALIRGPEVLFADEPTGDLDDENTRTVLSLFRETADTGSAVLLVTHEAEAERYADRVLHMAGGVLEKTGDD